MNEPYPKRTKMEMPNEIDPVVHSVTPKRIIVNTKTQDFKEIKSFLGFFDHSPFIHSFISTGSRKIAIFAPRRFGKSSHLNMVKEFLQIHRDENGKPDPRVNRGIFKDTEIITNPKYKDTVDQHMGKHPVIHIDLKKNLISTYGEALVHLRQVVHEAFKEHKYLRKSEKLDPENEEENAEHQRICGEWVSNSRHKQKTDEDLLSSLNQLAEYLHAESGERVYLLVDEFDAVNTAALYGCKGEILNGAQLSKLEQILKINNLVADMLSKLIKGNEAHVAGVLATGVSYIAGIGFSPLLNNMTKFRFLDGQKIDPRNDKGAVAFYGASRAEVEEVVGKLIEGGYVEKNFTSKYYTNGKLDQEKIMKVIDSCYNGYLDMEGNAIYSPWSVLQFLASGKTKCYWKETDTIQCLYMILRSGDIGATLSHLLKQENIQFQYLGKLELDNMLCLFDLILDNSVDDADEDVVLSLLMDQGYLTYVGENCMVSVTRDSPEKLHTTYTITGKFRIPNFEVQSMLAEMMRYFVKKCWRFSKHNIAKCVDMIDQVSMSKIENEVEHKEMMLNIHGSLQELLNGFKSPNPNTKQVSVNEAAVLGILYSVFIELKSFEAAPPDSRVKNDEGQCISCGCPDHFMIHKTEKFVKLWELKYKNKPGYQKMRTSVHALQEAKGKEPTEHNTTKDYMEALDELEIEKALIIGLSMDCETQVSLAYAEKASDKIFLISKSEYVLHKDYYESLPIVQFHEEATD